MKRFMSRIGYVLLGMALVIVPAILYSCSHEDSVNSSQTQADNQILNPDKGGGGVLPVRIDGDNVRVYNDEGRLISPVITELQDITIEATYDPLSPTNGIGITIDGSMSIHIDMIFTQ